MLTKLGLMALTATIGTAALSKPAAADEHNNNDARFERGYDHGDARFDHGSADNRDGRYGAGDARVDVRWDHVDGRFGVREGEFARRRAYEQMMRERRMRAMEHARWLHMHGYGYGYGYGNRGW